MQSLQKGIASLAASVNIEYIQIVLHRREEKTLKREREVQILSKGYIRVLFLVLFAQKCERSSSLTLISSENDTRGFC